MDPRDFVEGTAILIDSAPEAALLAADRDDDFIAMPYVAPPRSFSFQSAGVAGAKFQRPATDHFAGNHDAALDRHFLGQPQAQRKSEL